jgi:hypothetical protein
MSAAIRATARSFDTSVQGSEIVPTYRCFVLDNESHICERLSIESDSDDYAITQAGAVLERRPDMAAIEVWDGARLVQKLRQLSSLADRTS